MLLRFFRAIPKARRQAAEALYAEIVAGARNPVYYAELGVPDTVDGRFDMILLHAFAVMRGLRLRGQGVMAQLVYDIMFVDFDRAVREMGVGDLSVGKHIRRMMRAFNGRVHTYDAALGDRAALVEALRRNVYGTLAEGDIPPGAPDRLAAMVEALAAAEAQKQEIAA